MDRVKEGSAASGMSHTSEISLLARGRPEETLPDDESLRCGMTDCGEELLIGGDRWRPSSFATDRDRRYSGGGSSLCRSPRNRLDTRKFYMSRFPAGEKPARVSHSSGTRLLRSISSRALISSQPWTFCFLPDLFHSSAQTSSGCD